MTNPLAGGQRAGLRLHLVLAAVAYLPLLLTRPGWVSADTKTYLYLDPSRLLSRAWSMWDPAVGLGTVTHQTIGFLWPMGPFYWLGEAVGLPDWVTQRLWWGSIIFVAGAGVAYLLRTLGWRGPAITAATFTYALSPYLLTLISRLSAILLPFAALPWLLALAVQSVRHRGWRYPALFALAVTTFGSVNATALLLVGLAPALWLVHAVWGSREATVRDVMRAGAKMGVLTVPVAAWWIAGLSVQSTHGLNVLRYSETAETVASTSTSHEVLRSLGYWFFYGGDRLGPWIESSELYTQSLPVIGLTFLLPTLALLGAVVARWRHRAYFVLLLLVGTALAVGAYPWDGGPLLGRGFQAFFQTEAGLAMRSLPRAVPLVALSLAVLLGSGVGAMASRWPRLHRPLGPTVAVLALLTLAALWLGQFVPDNLRRREQIPDYWREAAAHLDAQDDATRVLVVPGSDFASYRWGNTVDPVLPGLTDRPSVARELIPHGSPASANLLNALDLPLQERTAQPDALAPIARLMRAGDVLVQSDLQYERYNTPRPRNLWDTIRRAAGLGEATSFGPGNPNETVSGVQLYDELFFLTVPSMPHPPELAVLPVDDPMPIVTTHSSSTPLLVAGDGAGLVEAAGAGLIDGTELIRYSATLTPDEIAGALDSNAALLLTDSNRKRGERWTHIRHTQGQTEPADGRILSEDLRDNRLPLFPDAGTDTQTVTVNRSGIDANATSYGNPITFTPEERPALAIDGDTMTAWRTAAFNDARGERLELTLSEPVTTDNVTLSQPTRGSITRYITKVRLRFDGGDPVDAVLSRASRRPLGQRIQFPERSFETLSIEILEDSLGPEVARYANESSVGFSEVEIGEDMPIIDVAVRLPTDLLDAAGADSDEHPLAISLKRERQDPTDVTRNDEEQALVRLLNLPTERSFALTGEARLSGRAEPYSVDDALGRTHDGSVPWARASSNLTGSVITPAAVFDGDPTTAWTTVRSRPLNQWVEVVLPEEVTIDRLPLTVVADGQHSVPTEIELWVDGEPAARVPLPKIVDGSERNSTVEVDVDVPRVTGSRFRVKLSAVRETLTNDWVSDNEVAQPAAIAEIGLPGPGLPALGESFDSGCRDDLLEIDGEPVPVRVTGSMSDALDAKPLEVAACDDAAVTLEGGEHEIRSARGLDTGIDIDQLVLRSAPGGAATSDVDDTIVAEHDDGASPDGSASEVPSVEIVDEQADGMRLELSGATPDAPFWLVLGESYNTGWEASLEGSTLPDPRLVNGFANGWFVIPTEESFQVDLRFAPQQRVDWALWGSLVAAAGCIVLLMRRPKPAIVAPSAIPEPYSPVLAFRYQGALPTRGTALVAGIALGIAAWLVAGPLVGGITGVAAGIGARQETFRRWLLLASPAALALAAAYVLYIQFRHAPELSFDWPGELSRVHPLGWLAVWLLAADVIVGRIWQSRSSEPQED